MGSDRARRSYDATRMYRSVVAQQGRVTLEADANEAEEIRGEDARATLIDVIGPTGSPDEGFLVTVPGGNAPLDFGIGTGTIYVGGQRVVCSDPKATYQGQKQTEWADYPAGRPAPEPAGDTPTVEAVYLFVWEQEVSAVEDQVLREVALGGPDTSARTRLIRRVYRVPTDATACADAFEKTLATYHADATFHPDTMQLVSTVQLKVDFVPDPAPADACQPTAQTGFLGSENQLIRVQVGADGKLLWAWDDASSLYRATVQSAKAVQLQGIPVDVFHQPRAGQWIEVLSDAVDLGGGDFVASPAGALAQVDQYDPTSRLVALKDATPLPDTLVNQPPKQAFVRVWERRFDFATDEKTATELVDALGTGTGVRIYTEGPARTAGDFWTIGVRPGAPDTILPARLREFQPPDGPRRWAAPLALVSWNADLETAGVADCRLDFDPLVDEDDSLEFHNRHLHGWGVVCGLQVECLRSAVDAIHRPRPEEWVQVQDGYAIDPTGADIRLEALANGVTPLELGDLAVTSGALARDANGKIADGSVSLWIDKDRKFHADAYTAPAGILQGTLLLDIYQGCFLPLIEFFHSELASAPTASVVTPPQMRAFSLLNLFWQVVSPENGQHIYLSGDPAGKTTGTEDAILRAFFEGLKDVLQDRTFCGLFDEVSYPKYDVFRDDLIETAQRPATIFSSAMHTRLRIHPTRPFAVTCGGGGRINVYNLSAAAQIAAVDFPVAGAEVQDVAFAPDQKTLYAVAWTGAGATQSVFATGTLDASGAIAWGAQISCPNLKLVTLATTPKLKDCVYASARGAGVFLFKGGNGPKPLVPAFAASGHLMIGGPPNSLPFLFAGVNDSDPSSVEYHRILGIQLADGGGPSGQPGYYALPANGSQAGVGHDEIAIIPDKNGQAALDAIVDGATPGAKRLVRWGLEGATPAKPGKSPDLTLDLGPGEANSIAYTPAGRWALITYADRYAGQAFRPAQEVIEPSALHPLQIGAGCVAASSDGAWLYVLNPLSHTITVVPAKNDSAQSVIDLDKLKRYRQAALTAFSSAAGRLAQYLKDCICQHLLVDCPSAEGKVNLADVSFKEGRVHQICNFGHRKYVHTFPTVEYWLSIVPILPALKVLVAKFCCSVIAGSFGKLAEGFGAEIGPATALQNAFSYAKAAEIGAHLQGTGTKAKASALYYAGLLERAFRTPNPGIAAGQASPAEVTNRNVADATAAAGAMHVNVRGVQTVSGAASAGALFGAPPVNAGETVDLLVDPNGRVVGWKKVSGQPVPSDPAAEQIASLRRDLDAMTNANAKQAATIGDLDKRLTDMAAQLAALRH